MSSPKVQVSPRWAAAETVDGFRTSPPNEVLLEYARTLLERHPGARALDIGCGAARNALPLARLGFSVVGTDLSEPMLVAARERHRQEAPATNVTFLHAAMAPLPAADASADLVVAHGIWNLARTDAELRTAISEAARVARDGAGLFLFTFSRATLPPGATPVAGQHFVFTQFSGEPMVFLTEAEVFQLLGDAGFVRDPQGPLTEYNRPSSVGPTAGPVLLEGTFTRIR